MKLILFFIFYFLFQLNTSELQNEGGRILWTSTRKLSWEDYKGAPNFSVTHSAMTCCNLSSFWKTKGDTAYFTIKAIIKKMNHG